VSKGLASALTHPSHPPGSLLLQHFTKEQPYAGTLTARPKDSALKALAPPTSPLSQASSGTKLPQRRAEQHLCLVKSNSPLSNAKSVSERELHARGSPRGFSGRRGSSATFTTRFVRALWGQQALVTGSWEQVSAQHYKGNRLQKYVTSHTNFLTCSSIPDTSKHCSAPLSSLG